MLHAVIHPETPAGVAEAIADTPRLNLVRAKSDREVIQALHEGVEILITHAWDDRYLTPDLRWVQSTAAGTDQFPIARLDRAGVVLTSARGIHIAVAEGVFGLILALTRGIADAIRDGQRHLWVPRRGPELAGSTIGIIGLGAIGEAIAERAQGWDVELVGVKRNPDHYEGRVPTIYGPDDIIEVCRRSDIVVLTLPASSETHHIISRSELNALGGGYLVNVGRGSVVDERALIEALTDGHLAGAGLDVFEVEPLPVSSPLWDLPNVIVTPHSVGGTKRYGERLADVFRHNMEAFQSGSKPWMNRIQGN